MDIFLALCNSSWACPAPARKQQGFCSTLKGGKAICFVYSGVTEEWLTILKDRV